MNTSGFNDNAAIQSATVLSSEDAIISNQLDGAITSWSPAAERMFGFIPEDAIGNHISLIIPPELLYEETDIITRIKKGGKVEHFETMCRRKDDSRFPVAITISPLKDAEQNIIGVSKIIRDITSQKNAEEKQALLAAIIDSSDDAIISKNLDGIITSWNKGAEAIFGYTAEEITGKHISVIIPLSKMEEEMHIIENIRRGNRVSHIETVRRRKDGSEINISVTISPVKNSKGKIIGASKIGRDITEKAELERQKKLVIEKLQELNNYKDEFMAMASHELKTPATVVKASLQVLEMVLSDKKQLGLVKNANAQIDKLTNLITDVFDVSKMQLGKLELQLSDFDMGELLLEVINNMKQISPEHALQLAVPQRKVWVNGDRIRIEQVIVNIISNAIKYSPNAMEVLIDLEIKDGKALITITDNGIGIAKEDQDKIFTRYFRVAGIASTFTGSGIGLYISSKIIKRHGGDIWVESEPGKGSVFSFTLAVAKDNN